MEMSEKEGEINQMRKRDMKKRDRAFRLMGSATTLSILWFPGFARVEIFSCL